MEKKAFSEILDRSIQSLNCVKTKMVKNSDKIEKNVYYAEFLSVCNNLGRILEVPIPHTPTKGHFIPNATKKISLYCDQCDKNYDHDCPGK